MKRFSATARLTAVLLGFSLFFPFLPQASAEAPKKSPNPLGRLVLPEGGQVVVQRETFQCLEAPTELPDISLLVIGAQSEENGEPHFHPLGALAFDRTLADEPGQWLAYWVFGPSSAGVWRTFRAFLPVPAGAPKASQRELIQLEEQLGAIQSNPEKADLEVPSPVVHLANLGRAPLGDGFWGALRRGLSWADVFNPAQFVYRSYLHRRKDRRERQFQRAYLGMEWLVDVDSNDEVDPRWVSTTTDLRFHLLKTRSFFGRFMTHVEGLELVHDYESDVRRQLGKTSSWLQSAANEHHLRYQPIYRYSENGSGFPMGGVLYYDAQMPTQPDPGWWSVANPFDLPYNPHTRPEVQKMAREHPDELIPLAIYSFQTSLALRPIIVVDFFAPGNPQRRESMYQMMVLTRQWLAITTSALGYERIPYRMVSWAANKKGFTYFVDKSSRLGIEEMRLALESDLYFKPETAEGLLTRVDQRVLNPLVKPGPVEEQMAHIQYQSLRALSGRALCQQVNDVRAKMRSRLGVPDGLKPAKERRELARRLDAWHQQGRLEDFVSEPLDDFGSLGSLRAPLEFFRTHEPVNAKELEQLLAKLYGKLYLQQLLLPDGRSVEELDSTLALTRAAWRQRFPQEEEFAERTEKAEQKARQRQAKIEHDREEDRAEALRDFFAASRKELRRAADAGCSEESPVPPELEAHLALLAEILQEARNDPKLTRELERHSKSLGGDLEKLQATLGRCPASAAEPMRADLQDSCLELARALQQQLSGPHSLPRRGGD